MAWTEPITWASNDLVNAADMNEQIRDNLDYLNGMWTAHDADLHTDGTRKIFLRPMGSLANVDDGLIYDIIYHTGSTSYTDVRLILPGDWVTGGDCTLTWILQAAASSGPVYAREQKMVYMPNDPWYAGGWGEYDTKTLTSSNMTFWTATDGASFNGEDAPDRLCLMRFYRWQDHANDTLEEDLYLLGVIVEYQVTQEVGPSQNE